ncbi:MAG: nucleoside triphosphate pyrophosphohydrolase [Candidatus Dormibacteraceae bacterium]
MSERASPHSPGLAALFEVVHRLRAPDGCPWDREQTHQSLRPYLLEETYEVLEAIDSGDDGRLREELGDLLLQVAMHAEIASEAGRFDAADVSEGAAAKMVGRHPHVFGDVTVEDAAEVLRNWERGKSAEAAAAGRPDESALDRVPRSMPALAWALGLQKRATRVGLPSVVADGSGGGRATVVADLLRELAEASRAGEVSTGDDELFAEFGDLLFALVGLGRALQIDPEGALRVAGRRFLERFRVLDVQARERGTTLRDMDPALLRDLWRETGQAPDGH